MAISPSSRVTSAETGESGIGVDVRTDNTDVDGTVVEDRTDWLVETGTDNGTNCGEGKGTDEVDTGGLETELDRPQGCVQFRAT